MTLEQAPPNLCPCSSANDAATLLFRLQIKKIEHYVSKYKLAFKYREIHNTRKRYQKVLDDYFKTNPKVRKLVERTHYGKAGDYSALITKLIQNGA